MNFKATCAWDGVNPWAMVFHNGSGSSLYCKDPCHFKDNIFGRGPSTQFTCQFNSNNLKSFFKRILKWYSINSFTLWWQYQSRVYMYFYYFCIRLTLHWIYLWTFKFPWKSSHHIHSIGSTYSNTQTSQTTYKDQSLSCSFCLWAFFLGGGGCCFTFVILINLHMHVQQLYLPPFGVWLSVPMTRAPGKA